ncbi:hypothetical protein EJB05_30889, partial [Eragrostis curvula]
MKSWIKLFSGRRRTKSSMAHAKEAGHLTVPNVQALAQTWNESGEQVPERYVRTEQAGDEEVVVGSGIPVVDLGRLLDPQSSEEELRNLGSACQQGFFQIINHGVPHDVIHDMRRDITEFFKLPLEAKEVYAQLPDSVEGYGQAFVFSETQKLEWADMIYLMVRPAETRNMRFWPAQPPSLRDSVDRYSTEVANVVSCLLRFMAADMGLKQPERLLEMFAGQPQTMRVAYYPPCRQAGKVIGMSPHTDSCALTLLLHVNDVQGAFRSGGTMASGTLLTPLTAHSSSALETHSNNGRYRSIEHRAMVHPDKERISAAMFHLPCPSVTIGPLPELVEGGVRARYKSVGHAEFVERFFATKLDGRRSNLEYYRI